MAKVASLLVRGREIKLNQEHHNGVLDPLVSIILACKGVGKMNRAKPNKSPKFTPNRMK